MDRIDSRMLLLIEPHSAQLVPAHAYMLLVLFFSSFFHHVRLRQRVVHYSAQYRRMLESFRENRLVPFRGNILVPLRRNILVPFRGNIPIVPEAPHLRSCIPHPTRTAKSFYHLVDSLEVVFFSYRPFTTTSYRTYVPSIYERNISYLLQIVILFSPFRYHAASCLASITHVNSHWSKRNARENKPQGTPTTEKVHLHLIHTPLRHTVVSIHVSKHRKC